MSLRASHIRLAASIMVIVIAACDPESSPTITSPAVVPVDNAGGVPHNLAAAALGAVRSGNDQVVAAAPFLVPPGAPLAPFIEARLYAMTNIAMHDALNAIVPRFERYADSGPVYPDASLAVAVVTAAHDVIVGAAPAATASTDAWYADALDTFTTPGFAQGVAIGQRVAAAILARRATDGTAGGGVAPYTPGTNPGDYQFTFPFNTPGFDFFGTGGFADASIWGASVTPFVVTSTSQFRVGRPYGAPTNALAVQTAQYTEDFDEVKAMGCAVCPARPASQTEIALFWLENSPTGFNRIARVIADQRNLDAWNTARLFALLQMGQFDSYATNLESKYYYNFWRPVTAIALAGSDGNPSTTPSAGWEVVGFPTPPVPDYPSAHAGAGGTAAAIIEALVPGRGPRISTTSGSLPGVTRTFGTIADAALENAESRVFVGFHFRHATEAGLDQGRDVGKYVADNALRSLK